MVLMLRGPSGPISLTARHSSQPRKDGTILISYDDKSMNCSLNTYTLQGKLVFD